MFLVRADASVAAFQSHFGGLGHIRGGDRVDDWLVRFCFRLAAGVNSARPAPLHVPQSGSAMLLSRELEVVA